jgi:hypothetical protein
MEKYAKHKFWFPKTICFDLWDCCLMVQVLNKPTFPLSNKFSGHRIAMLVLQRMSFSLLTYVVSCICYLCISNSGNGWSVAINSRWNLPWKGKCICCFFCCWWNRHGWRSKRKEMWIVDMIQVINNWFFRQIEMTFSR